MKLVIQSVSSARVEVEGEKVAEINNGFLILVGFTEGDDKEAITLITKKVAALRVLPDDEGKLNRSIKDVAGEILLVPQFTLYADTGKGNRPSYSKAAPTEVGRELFDRLVESFNSLGLKVERGRFGAKMKVTLANEGPVTIILEN